MNLKKTLTKGALRMLEDPRVHKLVQDPRVWRGISAAWSARGELVRNFDEHSRRIAKELGLKTPAEVRELERTIEELRSELERVRARELSARTPRPARKATAKPKAKKASTTQVADEAAATEATTTTDRSPRRRARRAPGPGNEPQPL